jgi:predicted transcriptional regulator
MSDTTTVTARLPKALDAELKKIAKRYRRSRSFMIAEAISDLIEMEKLRQAALQEGREAIRRGAYAEHDEVEAWARSLGSAKQRPRPDRKRARAA